MIASLHRIRPWRAIFFATALRAALFAAAGAAVVAAGGCVHRVEIRQGDLRVAQNAESVSAGMSESEVEELLGRPQTESPFRRGQWIYFYKKRAPGFFGKTGQFVLKVYFEDKRVRELQILEEGDLSDVAAARRAEAEEAEAAEAADEAEADGATEEESGAEETI